MAKSKKSSIYLNPTLEAVKASSPKGIGYAVTYRINRYNEICQRYMPYLSEAELDLVAEAVHDRLPIDDAGMLGGLWAASEYAIRAGAERHQVNADDLMHKLNALDYASNVALVDKLEATRLVFAQRSHNRVAE